jgi:hypothetical protein
MVGRADDGLAGRLEGWVGKSYSRFKFSYAASKTAAFEKECKNYHNFGGPQGKLDNNAHPVSFRLAQRSPARTARSWTEKPLCAGCRTYVRYTLSTTSQIDTPTD